MNKEIDNLKEETETPVTENDSGTLLKKKLKKIKDPNAPKKILTEGQKKALSLMNDARTKKKEERLKKEYEKIIERKNKTSAEEVPVIKKIKPTKPETSTDEEVTVIKKKKKKIIVIEESDESSEEEPEIIYKSREMKSQQNRRNIIQQHNEKQTQKNFFCS